MASKSALSPGKQAAQAALGAAEARFVVNNPFSKAKHDLALGSLPGGNTRTLLHTSPFPLCMKQGKEAYVWDLDGHKYASSTTFFLPPLWPLQLPFTPPSLTV